ncbi:protein THEMIS2 [Amblyraja radiata]|uniref:protein THEMIS2 n=1 Tax=Amblyraja radiata TaxID=386614 RepID=UPI001402C8D9|nr:protein THEMIS2 [Amblyraja radiata]
MADLYHSDSEIIALQDYICSLNISTLPRILEIHSGVYFQGSVYEISGNECCLSTGEFIKIIHIELQKVGCNNLDNDSTFDLPLNYPGNFVLIPEGDPYTSIEEIIQAKELERQNSEEITFCSMTDIIIDQNTIRSREPITVISTVVQDGHKFADCIVDGNLEQLHVMLPFVLKGQFNECEDDKLYTVNDIIESQTLTKRKVMLAETEGINTPYHCKGPLIISPVYEIQAIMNFRKEAVKIPSTLEVDVRDVTEEQKNITFIKPMSLTDIANQSHQMLPIMAKILDAPDQQAPFMSEWFHSLRKERNIIIYKKVVVKKILATSVRNKISRHFLISDNYKGTFRRRPREFPTVFDLCEACTQDDPLYVVVTRDCTWNEDGLSSLCIGDHLVTMFKTTSQVVIGGAPQNMDVLACSKIPEEDDDDDDGEKDVSEPLMLPHYLEGHFVEEIHDTKKYKISEIFSKFKFPCHVKVTSKDQSLPTDSLTSFPTIKLEKILEVPTLIVSFLEKSSECFAIPIEWVTMNVQVLEDYAGKDCSYESTAPVEELTNFMYYNLWKVSSPSHCPPPRPPKRLKAATLSPAPAPARNPSHSPVPGDKQHQPPLLPKRQSMNPISNVTKSKELPLISEKLILKQQRKAAPNEYVKPKKMKGKKTAEPPEVQKLNYDSDHDYEQMIEVSKPDSDNDYEPIEACTQMSLQAMKISTP